MEFLAALQFLTILPITRGFTAQEIGRSTVFFPVVGIIIGLILAGLHWLLSLILPFSLVNIIVIATLALLSGALHLDGLADTLDGIAGHRTAEQRLEIMRDSRIGGFGAIGLGLFLLMEYVALNSIPANWVVPALVLAPTLSRWSMVVAIFCYPYARTAGLGTPFRSGASRWHLIVATVTAIVIAGALFSLGGLVIVVLVYGVVTFLALHLKRTLGGLTGDTYGAINEIATLSAFVLVSMLAYKQWLI